MRKIGIFMLTAIVAVGLMGCGAPASNTTGNGSNANANTGKTTAAAPTIDALMALDKQANEAYFKGDSKFFEGFLSDKFAEVHGGTRVDKAMALKGLGGVKCELKEGWSLGDPQISMVDADTYVFSYKGTFDGSCTMEGKTEKIPSPIRAATVFVRNGDKWQAAFHGENLIIDPKAAPPASPDKPEVKKEEAKPAEKPASNSNSAPAAPAPAKSANTDALVAVEKSGWEAWKAKDGAKLDALTAKNLTILAPDGTWMNRAEALKFWVGMPCENIKTVDVKNGFGAALSSTVEMLTFQGSADGTCYGQKNGTQDSMSIYVKEGDAWKLAFGFSAATM